MRDLSIAYVRVVSNHSTAILQSMLNNMQARMLHWCPITARPYYRACCNNMQARMLHWCDVPSWLMITCHLPLAEGPGLPEGLPWYFFPCLTVYCLFHSDYFIKDQFNLCSFTPQLQTVTKLKPGSLTRFCHLVYVNLIGYCWKWDTTEDSMIFLMNVFFC